jgi:uncharacterized RDD family membrane protein YckC
MTTLQERVSLFLEGSRRQRREIMTPEGVPLHVDLAEHGERAASFAIDLFIWLCTTIVIYLVIVGLVLGGATFGVAVTINLFVAFLVRTLYFIYFELAWQGSTPGKRVNRLRVIDRRGGPLLPGAVVARNLTREVEVFLPLGLLLSARAGVDTWQSLSLGAWFALFVALPLFNRDRLRAGDFIAGTMVISLPKRLLLGDLVEAAARFKFTPKQLAAYGAFELQVLEELLRRPRSEETMRLLVDVREKICRKIEHPLPPESETVVFLTEFYAAERAFLENERLFGTFREDKQHGIKTGA